MWCNSSLRVATTVAEITLNPIGYFRGPRVHKSSIPHQGAVSHQRGLIEFVDGFDFKTALRGLEEMTHCWLIFHFHQCEAEPKPLIRPPRRPEIQVGVWATRSPYRPNYLGLTLAQIVSISEGKLHVSRLDLLDQTPILDIKPYSQEADHASEPLKQGWIDEIEHWSSVLTTLAQQQVKWLESQGMTEIRDVLQSQLGTPPHQEYRKRIQLLDSSKGVLSYRTWRIHFHLDSVHRIYSVLSLNSGYSRGELQEPQDPYGDKDLHRRFVTEFKL